MYGKLFASLFTGSMRGKGDLQLTFAYMLANASSDGICDFAPQCISDATGKPLKLIESCIEELSAPDPMSRTRTDEGRRIALLDPSRPWGWRIINHAIYRAIQTREAMKEAERLRKREYRASKSAVCPGLVRDEGGHAGSGSVSDSGQKEDRTGKKPEVIATSNASRIRDASLEHFVIPSNASISVAVDAVRACHPAFGAVPVMALENAFRTQPDKGKWEAAVNDMALHYAGAQMPVPVRTLTNYLAGKPSKSQSPPAKKYIPAALYLAAERERDAKATEERKKAAQ